MIAPGGRYHPREPGFKTLSIFDKYESTAEALDRARRARPFDQVEVEHLEELWLNIRARAVLIDPYWDMERHLWIADENRKDMLFSPRRAQRKIADYIYAARQDKKPQHPFGRPVRLYLPKARRIGISEIIAAIFYLIWRNEPSTYAYVLAHRKKEAKEIFGKYRRFLGRDPMAPQLERESSTELVAMAPHESELHVDTAGVADSSQGQGFGWTLFHVSEAAHLRTNNPHALLSGIYAAMPSPSVAWSAAVEESTGKTINGPFYETCKMLHDAQHNKGDVDAEHAFAHLMFLPSFERDTAFIPFENRKAAEAFVKDLTDDELAIMDNYRPPEISEERFLEFLNWRRYEYDNNIKGTSEAERRREQKRQHPITFTDCFVSQGGSAFDLNDVDRQMLRVKDPKWRGDLSGRGAIWSETGDHVEVTPRAELVHHIDGPLWIWQRPMYGHAYALGVDCSRGTEAGDFDVIMVFDRTTQKFVARYRNRVKTHRFAVTVRLLSKWYKDGIINVEVNVGAAIVDKLALTDRQPLLVKRRNPSGVDVVRGPGGQYGTYMTNPYKVQMVALLGMKLDKKPDMFVDRLLLEEMRDYQAIYNVETDFMKFSTAKGKHDDVVVAAGLALEADENVQRPAGTAPQEQWRPPKPADHVRKFEESQMIEDDFDYMEAGW